VFGKGKNRFVACAAQEATEEGAIRGSAVREFVVHESGGQHALSCAAGHEESKAGRKRPADFFVVAEGHGDGRTVVHSGELRRKVRVAHLQQAGGGLGGESQDHGGGLGGVQCRGGH